MQSLASIFAASYMLAFSGAAMPGPLLTVTVTESARRGITAGPLIILGHAILESALIALLFLGVAPLLSAEPAFIVVSLLGGLIMLYLAFGMFRALPALTLPGQSNERGGRRLLLSGIFMSLANPYWTIWWATIGLGYVLGARSFGFPGVVLFFLGHILGDLTWYSFVSFSVSKGKKLMNDTAYRWLIGICACFLGGFAVYLLIGGIRRWVG